MDRVQYFGINLDNLLIDDTFFIKLPEEIVKLIENEVKLISPNLMILFSISEMRWLMSTQREFGSVTSSKNNCLTGSFSSVCPDSEQFSIYTNHRKLENDTFSCKKTLGFQNRIVVYDWASKKFSPNYKCDISHVGGKIDEELTLFSFINITSVIALVEMRLGIAEISNKNEIAKLVGRVYFEGICECYKDDPAFLDMYLRMCICCYVIEGFKEPEEILSIKESKSENFHSRIETMKEQIRSLVF